MKTLIILLLLLCLSPLWGEGLQPYFYVSQTFGPESYGALLTGFKAALGLELPLPFIALFAGGNMFINSFGVLGGGLEGGIRVWYFTLAFTASLVYRDNNSGDTFTGGTYNLIGGIYIPFTENKRLHLKAGPNLKLIGWEGVNPKQYGAFDFNTCSGYVWNLEVAFCFLIPV